MNSILAWENHRFEGFFSINLPSFTRVTLESDSTMVVFSLPTDPVTEILAGVFPAKSGYHMSQLELRDEITRFMIDCVKSDKMTIENPVDVERHDVISYQAVTVLDEEDRWLIARVYGRKSLDQFLLIHWNGPAEQLKDIVLPAFVSIEFLMGNY